jgi:hypothetical protein
LQDSPVGHRDLTRFDAKITAFAYKQISELDNWVTAEMEPVANVAEHHFLPPDSMDFQCVCKDDANVVWVLPLQKVEWRNCSSFFSSATACNKMEIFSCHEAGISSAALPAPLLMPCYVIVFFKRPMRSQSDPAADRVCGDSLDVARSSVPVALEIRN